MINADRFGVLPLAHVPGNLILSQRKSLTDIRQWISDNAWYAENEANLVLGILNEEITVCASTLLSTIRTEIIFQWKDLTNSCATEKNTCRFIRHTVYPKKYAHGFCFAVLCCGYTLTDFPISIRLTSLALWQSNDCPSASKATLMNMEKYFMWIHYERLHNHNKAKHNKTVCIFLGIYCTYVICGSLREVW